MNGVTLSDDRRKLVITTPDGSGKATFWAQDPGGFTDEEVQLVREKVTMTYLTEQGRYSVRRTRWFGREVFLHRSSGKPTWWRPRVEVRRGRVLVGWLRRMVAVTW
ncbi:hypothetical protein SEA_NIEBRUSAYLOR_85 [Mycobacterium phage NiebruSaylor]|nr:hypothetical protein SEA_NIEBRUSAYLOR_85 [Mycobacterium phage NiebruSaylor]